ncbi:hypothetical protein ABZY57_06375 [Streptomyces sp. NPDC006450]|uniref:hypothetical protein n=1 Tax=Streptomyces sp. NPDC006450 TaxID=3155458 RepID=UPI0033B800F4
MDDFSNQGLRDAIAAARSPAWSERAAAGRHLAAAPQIESVAGVLHRLLLDATHAGQPDRTATS